MIFCTRTKFKYRFDSSDVKQNFIFQIKHFVYELPQELHYDIRLENRKYFENLKNEWRHLALITPCRDKTLIILGKKKCDIKFFCSCPILLDFFTQKFCFPGKIQFKDHLKDQSYILK